jgi:RimJ/RimL family protein N-acetyltransferase
MQLSWRTDADKLTFIVCRPLSTASTTEEEPSQHQLQTESDGPKNMIGDINLFLRIDDGEHGNSPPKVIGEIELMIAEKNNQRRGYGRAALLMFMRYIVQYQGAILEEFVGGGGIDIETVRKLRTGVEFEANETETATASTLEFECLSVKIGKENLRSLALFEALDFEKVHCEPNFFGEFELRRRDLSLGSIDGALGKAGVRPFVALPYERTE